MNRPFGVTLVVGVVLLFIGANVLAFVTGLSNQGLYRTAGAAPILSGRIAASAIFSLLGVISAIGLWVHHQWAFRFTLITGFFYAITRTLLWSVGATTTYEQGRWPFVLTVHMAVVLLVWFILTHRSAMLKNKESFHDG